jgi:hypothetical protein
MLGREQLVDEPDRDRPLADRGGDPAHRPVADVSGGRQPVRVGVRTGADDPVAPRVTVDQLTLDVTEQAVVFVHSEENRIHRAKYRAGVVLAALAIV